MKHPLPRGASQINFTSLSNPTPPHLFIALQQGPHWGMCTGVFTAIESREGCRLVVTKSRPLGHKPYPHHHHATNLSVVISSPLAMSTVHIITLLLLSEDSIAMPQDAITDRISFSFCPPYLPPPPPFFSPLFLIHAFKSSRGLVGDGGPSARLIAVVIASRDRGLRTCPPVERLGIQRSKPKEGKKSRGIHRLYPSPKLFQPCTDAGRVTYWPGQLWDRVISLTPRVHTEAGPFAPISQQARMIFS